MHVHMNAMRIGNTEGPQPSGNWRDPGMTRQF
jgi:hypothetical protein